MKQYNHSTVYNTLYINIYQSTTTTNTITLKALTNSIYSLFINKYNKGITKAILNDDYWFVLGF